MGFGSMNIKLEPSVSYFLESPQLFIGGTRPSAFLMSCSERLFFGINPFSAFNHSDTKELTKLISLSGFMSPSSHDQRFSPIIDIRQR